MISANRSPLRRFLAGACSSSALALVLASTAHAQAAVEPPAATRPPSKPVPADPDTIIIIGNRSIVTSLKDVPVELAYDEQSIDSYGVSTVGELLGQIRDENGDIDPALLINGQPVADAGNISDIPVEAIDRIEALPRGSAQRVGGAAGQRAYNVVLRSSVKSATVTASREVATEGGWAHNKGEGLLTYVRGQDRINLTLRGARSGLLRESERDFIPRIAATPFAPGGNIIPAFGTEVDPLLSALAGEPVSVVGLPIGDDSLTLADLVPGANRPSAAGDSAFRTLRGATRPYELALAGSKTLASWLSLQVNGRLGWTDNRSLNGLPSARFLIPSSNNFTPFSVPVSIALNDPDRPLTSRNQTRTQSLSAALNATLGDWRATVSGRIDHRSQNYRSQFTAPFAGAAGTVDPATNPFEGSLAALIPVGIRESRSDNRLVQFAADAEGPLLKGWAGPIRGRLATGLSWIDYEARDSAGSRCSFERREFLAKAGVTVPLTSRQDDFLSALGDSALSLEYGRVDQGKFGTLVRSSLSFEWQPLDWLRLVATSARDERAIIPELQAAPEVISVNVPYFDPLTGQTVDVTTISGGAAALDNEDFRTRSLALTATPWKKYGLHLDATYSDDRLRNLVGALPLPSPAVVAAFPDRFQRDSSGTLVLVDNRSVNFARQSSERLRLGVRLTVPLSAVRTISPDKAVASGARRRVPAWRLQANAAHTILLDSRTVIREGLGEIDLLKGGAIGIGGGQQRHSTTGSVAVTRGATGVRLEVARRGASSLATGSPSDPDLLAFGALTTVDLKLLADLGQLLPNRHFFKDTRFTLAFDNLANQRQRVINLAGDTPQAYQPVRRDALGRTVKIELRKVF